MHEIVTREDLSALEMDSQREPERRRVELRQAAPDVDEIHPHFVTTRSLFERFAIEFDRRTYGQIRIRRSPGNGSTGSCLGDTSGVPQP